MKASELALPPQKPESGSGRKQKRDEAQKDVFLREVDEALRQDEMLGFMKRYGIPLFAVILLGLGAFGGYLWWQEHQEQAKEKRGEDLIIALDQLDAGKLKDADGKLNPLANGGDDANAVAAKLLRADIALKEKRPKDAAKIYDAVAADAKAPQPYRDLATVRSVAARYDEMKPQEVVDRLKPLAVPGSPWFGVAGEMVGMAYLQQDKKDLAGPLFADIAKDETLPDTVRQRARQLSGSLGVDALDDVIDADAVKKGEGGSEEANANSGAPAG